MRRILAVTSLMMFAGSSLAATRVVWWNGRTVELSDNAMMKYRVAVVPAEYPQEAQRKKLSGSGMFVVGIDKRGNVTAVAIQTSTGSRVLDQAAIGALRKCRYKPGAFRRVFEPVEFHQFGKIHMRF